MITQQTEVDSVHRNGKKTKPNYKVCVSETYNRRRVNVRGGFHVDQSDSAMKASTGSW